MSKEEEILKYYTDYISNIFNNLNIDKKIDVLYHLTYIARTSSNIRSISTYKNNLYHNEYENYYNKKLDL